MLASSPGLCMTIGAASSALGIDELKTALNGQGIRVGNLKNHDKLVNLLDKAQFMPLDYSIRTNKWLALQLQADGITVDGLKKAGLIALLKKRDMYRQRKETHKAAAASLNDIYAGNKRKGRRDDRVDAATSPIKKTRFEEEIGNGNRKTTYCDAGTQHLEADTETEHEEQGPATQQAAYVDVSTQYDNDWVRDDEEEQNNHNQQEGKEDEIELTAVDKIIHTQLLVSENIAQKARANNHARLELLLNVPDHTDTVDIDWHRFVLPIPDFDPDLALDANVRVRLFDGQGEQQQLFPKMVRHSTIRKRAWSEIQLDSDESTWKRARIDYVDVDTQTDFAPTYADAEALTLTQADPIGAALVSMGTQTAPYLACHPPPHPAQPLLTRYLFLVPLGALTETIRQLGQKFFHENRAANTLRRIANPHQARSALASGFVDRMLEGYDVASARRQFGVVSSERFGLGKGRDGTRTGPRTALSWNMDRPGGSA